MKILIATDSSEINEYFAVRFVDEGIEPRKTIQEGDIISIIQDKELDALFIDLESGHYKGLETLKEVREKVPTVSFIVLTAKTGVEFVTELGALGVFGVVSKLDDMKGQFENAISLLDNLKARRDEKRRHIRVQPIPSQHNLFKIKIPGLDSIYQGQVKDISKGGIAITFSKPPPESLFFMGKEVEISIELGALNLQSSAKVVLMKGMEATLLFHDVSEGYKRRLFEYILTRLD